MLKRDIKKIPCKEGDTPMIKKCLLLLIVLALLSSFVGACSIRMEVPASTKARMGSADFIDKEVSIKKGESVALVDTTSTNHVIANGTWQGKKAKALAESGAPVVGNLSFSGNDTKNIGPFTSAGTFQFYCTIHPGMNLAVKVS